MAAMARADMPRPERRRFYLYVDEFQNFSTDSFASILSEARKYRLNLIVANQFTTQLSDEIRDAVFGNVGTIVSFRVGTADAEFLVKQFTPMFDTDDLQRIPNYNAVVRMLIGGIPTQPFSMAGLPPLGNPSKELGDALKQLSAVKHGRPRAIIEKEIFERLQTSDDQPTAAKPVAGRMGGQPAAQPQRPTTGSSFLDDWLHKKETNSFRPPTSPFNNQNPAQAPAQMPPQPVLGAQQAPLQTNPSQYPLAPQNDLQQPSSAPVEPQVVSQVPPPAPAAAYQPVAPVENTPTEGVIDHSNSSDDETTIQIR